MFVQNSTSMGYSLGKEDLKVVPLLKSIVAELLGTMFLVIIGCGAAMQWKMALFDTTQVCGSDLECTSKKYFVPRYLLHLVWQ